MRTFPLYTASLEGKSYSNGLYYELVIVTKWSDNTASAKEVAHKTYYFYNANDYLSRNAKDESWCKELYEKFPEFSKLMVQEVLVNV